VEASDIVRTAVVRLDDTHELWFYTYSLGKRRLGGVRIHQSNAKYSGPTKSGFDMSLEQIESLGPALERLSRAVEKGTVIPPTEYFRIPAGKATEWVVQVLDKRSNSVELLLDIRKFVSSDRFTGFTRKGLRIDFEWIDTINDNLPAVRDALQAWHDGRWGLFAKGGSYVEETDYETPESVPDEYRSFF
jgi:hypothetical protein